MKVKFNYRLGLIALLGLIVTGGFNVSTDALGTKLSQGDMTARLANELHH